MGNRINIAVLRVYDHEKRQVLGGGMERWCRDIAYLARNKGYEVSVYQKDSIAFETNIDDGIKVVGVRCGPTWRSHWTFSKWMEKHVDLSDPCIYVSMELALSRQIQRAVAIQHGICWEGDFPFYKKWLNRKLQYQLIKRLRGVICVDTNYINWCHAEYPNRASWQHKLAYIPNYADTNLFPAVEEPPITNQLPNILFPRRVFGSRDPSTFLKRDSRGAGLFLDAIEILNHEGISLRLTFVGRGRLQSTISEWARQHGMSDRVTVTDVSLDAMPSMYAQANVVVIPSIEREGTSLSAIEAMISGIPTVVTHIGGLGNLVIDGLTGFISDLSPESLANSIRRALYSHRLPSGQILEVFRESMGKPRWELQVWKNLSTHLELT